MAQKKITELQLRSNVEDSLNFPSDDGIQTYRVTASQFNTYIQSKNGLTTTGDILIKSPSSQSDRLGVGSNGYFLSANSSVTKGLEYKLPYDQADALVNCTIAVSMAANAMTVAVKDNAGNNLSSSNIGFIAFGHSTITNPTYLMRTLTGALSIVAPSGSTFGCTAAKSQRYFVFLIDDNGTLDVGLCRMKLKEDELHTTVAISSGSSLTYVLYANSIHTNCRIRCIGEFYVTQATPGTHATAASKVTSGKRSSLPNQAISVLMCKTSSSNPGTTAATKVPWESVAESEACYDDYKLGDTTNERIYSRIAGEHEVFLDLSLANFEASTTLQVFLYKNGSSYRRIDVLSNSIGSSRNNPLPFKVEAAAGDYWEIFTQSGADNSYSAVGNSGVDTKSFFGMRLVGGL